MMEEKIRQYLSRLEKDKGIDCIHEKLYRKSR